MTEEVGFRTVAVSGGEEEGWPVRLLSEEQFSSKSRGWRSSRFPSFPLELGLQLTGPAARISKIELLADSGMVPRAIHIYNDDQHSWSEAYENSVFRFVGTVRFDPPVPVSHDHRRPPKQLRRVKLDVEASCLRLVLDQPHPDPSNPFGQVALLAVRVWGTPIGTVATVTAGHTTENRLTLNTGAVDTILANLGLPVFSAVPFSGPIPGENSGHAGARGSTHGLALGHAQGAHASELPGLPPCRCEDATESADSPVGQEPNVQEAGSTSAATLEWVRWATRHLVLRKIRCARLELYDECCELEAARRTVSTFQGQVCQLVRRQQHLSASERFDEAQKLKADVERIYQSAVAVFEPLRARDPLADRGDGERQNSNLMLLPQSGGRSPPQTTDFSRNAANAQANSKNATRGSPRSSRSPGAGQGVASSGEPDLQLVAPLAGTTTRDLRPTSALVPARSPRLAQTPEDREGVAADGSGPEGDLAAALAAAGTGQDSVASGLQAAKPVWPGLSTWCLGVEQDCMDAAAAPAAGGEGSACAPREPDDGAPLLCAATDGGVQDADEEGKEEEDDDAGGRRTGADETRSGAAAELIDTLCEIVGRRTALFLFDGARWNRREFAVRSVSARIGLLRAGSEVRARRVLWRVVSLALNDPLAPVFRAGCSMLARLIVGSVNFKDASESAASQGPRPGRDGPVALLPPLLRIAGHPSHQLRRTAFGALDQLLSSGLVTAHDLASSITSPTPHGSWRELLAGLQILRALLNARMDVHGDEGGGGGGGRVPAADDGHHGQQPSGTLDVDGVARHVCVLAAHPSLHVRSGSLDVLRALCRVVNSAKASDIEKAFQSKRAEVLPLLRAQQHFSSG